MIDSTAIAFVIALWSTVHPTYGRGHDRVRIAEALVSAVNESCGNDTSKIPAEFNSPEDLLSTISYYVVKESGASENPMPFSWDAKDGVSCGILQEPCAFVHTHSLREQALWWINSVQHAGLRSVDSDTKRALKRHMEARQLVAKMAKQNEAAIQPQTQNQDGKE